MITAIPYYRVSTLKQEESGLGLEAQRHAVQDYARRNGLLLLDEHVEVESGGKIKRPVLNTALASCKANKALLLIAKFDRLARNVAFVSRLMESGIEFRAVDNPHASKLVIHIMVAVAEDERERISKRTSEAMQALKRRGVPLGTYMLDVLSKQNKEAADAFAAKMQPIIEELQAKGFKSIRRLSKELNRRKILPQHGAGCKFHPATVFNILSRIARRKAANQ